MDAKDPVMVLGERSQRRGTGNFREAYSITEERIGEQQWKVSIKDNESGEVCVSAVHSGKKKATKEAASRLLESLGEGIVLPVVAASPPLVSDSLNDDALAGDKVLGLCLVLWLRGCSITDKGDVTRHVANLLSNEALQRNAHKIGVKISGHQTHRDGSLVEQHVWRMFCEYQADIMKTMEHVLPLFHESD
jgi:dsRNA-specific ribonuclease